MENLQTLSPRQSKRRATGHLFLLCMHTEGSQTCGKIARLRNGGVLQNICHPLTLEAFDLLFCYKIDLRRASDLEMRIQTGGSMGLVLVHWLATAHSWDLDLIHSVRPTCRTHFGLHRTITSFPTCIPSYPQNPDTGIRPARHAYAGEMAKSTIHVGPTLRLQCISTQTARNACTSTDKIEV